ncbi:MAG: cytidine deaminase [Bacteroidetes bacterium]|nr:cytidine deaminase [Bacteroidota bacterium]
MPLHEEIIEQLVATAREARESAYAPYSGFRVGAALLSDDGEIFTGCNVENSSYGLTCCAERTAVYTAVTAGVQSFLAIAVAADGVSVPPCGACRQVLSEFAPALPVILAGSGNEHRMLTLTNLLPEPFNSDFLHSPATDPHPND